MVGALSDLSTKAVIATLLWEFDHCRGVTDPLDTSKDTPTNMVLPLHPVVVLLAKLYINDRRFFALPFQLSFARRRAKIFRDPS